MIHEFSRTELLLGPEAMERLKQARGVIFGVGGVGSHCIDALARSGIGHLTLIDSDRVSLTNINRQSVASHRTIGQYKTQVMKEQIHEICPKIQVETLERFILKEDLSDLFENRPDYIVDAVDTVTAKLNIAECAVRLNIPLISSMGTGNKLQPVDVSGNRTGEETKEGKMVPGSISFVPPVAGLLIAGEVIRALAAGHQAV